MKRVPPRRRAPSANQPSTSALAMFRDGKVILGNAHWRTLANGRGAASGWIVATGREQRGYDDLSTLGASELERLGRTGTVTLRVQRRDGTRQLRLRLDRVTHPGERPTGLVVADDMTREKALSREVADLRDTLRKREQMTALGRMAAGLAHDLGNTLNALALRVERLSRASKSDPEDLKAIGEAVGMMRLTLERLDRFSGRRSRPPQAVQLREVLHAAIGIAGLRPGSRGRERGPRVSVVTKLPRKLPRVLANQNELCNVFVNLLLNARDAMPEGGKVLIDVSVGAREVIVRVGDEGPGFLPEHLDRVFEPFFTTKGAKGSGLGLSLAYGFLRSIGGRIRAANRIGGGAELTIELHIARG
jgi:signal transduction histidine kinase